MPSRKGHEETACQLEYSKTRIGLEAAVRNFILFVYIPFLTVNEGKTKYMLSTGTNVQRIGSQIMAVICHIHIHFNIVKEFIYLGSAVTTKNNVSLEIILSTIASRCYYGLNRHLGSRDLSPTTKLILYKTLILLVIQYEAEAWTLLSTAAAALRKILSFAFNPTMSCMSSSTI